MGRSADWNDVFASRSPHFDDPSAMLSTNDGVATIPTFDDNLSPYLNRELSWLAFNARVLSLAGDPMVPLLERVRFLSIFSSNLDEFFQVRVAGLKDQVAGELAIRGPDGRTAVEQVDAVSEIVRRLAADKHRIYSELVTPGLADNAIAIVGFETLGGPDREYLTDYFQNRIFPVLTPLAIDPGHPFPYISDLSLNLAVSLRDPESSRQLFARVKIPTSFPRLIPLPGLNAQRFVLIEDLIRNHLEILFSGMSIESTLIFRVTRNADLTYEEEVADDLLFAVEMELRRRRFGRAIRLQVSPDADELILGLLLDELDLEPDDVFVERAMVDMTGLDAIADIDRDALRFAKWSPVTPGAFRPVDDERVDLFDRLRNGDVLVHHPYESFTDSVAELIHQASIDAHVLAIKMTLYRTSGDSPIIDSLVRAAESGKQVAVLIELKARFDEKANIGWARRLEQAGVHVAYGLIGLKIHSKTIMIVREEGRQIRRYCHIGTGNYNHRTARLYEDLGLLTADQKIGNDLANLFNQLTGYGRTVDYARLLVAPDQLRPALNALIERESKFGSEGRIVMKMNSLVDPDIIDQLYKASEAGVQIDLIVRGICGLRPGLEDYSENIRVRSLVGRFLEHSRVFYFGHGAGKIKSARPAYFLGSADMMPRNLDRRVEVLTAIKDPDLQAKLDVMLDILLDDEQLTWHLHADGRWTRQLGGTGSNAHELFQHLALADRVR